MEDLKTQKSLITPSPENIEDPEVKDIFKKMFSENDLGHKKIYEDLKALWRILAGLDAMANALNMGSNKITAVTDPTADQEAATKKYVDDLIAAVAQTEFRADDLMHSTAATTPTGWTDRTATYAGKYMRVGSTGFATGGSATHDHGAATGSHTLTIAQMPSHRHTIHYGYGGTSATQNVWADSDNDNAGTGTRTTAIDTTGGGGGHTHTISSADNNPVFVDMKLYEKD